MTETTVPTAKPTITASAQITAPEVAADQADFQAENPNAFVMTVADYNEALKEAIRRSAADPGNVAEGLYDDLESEIYTPEHQAEYQKTLLRVIHENIDSFGF